MEEEIRLLNTKLDYFEGNLLSAKTKIKTLDEKNKALKYRLTLEKAEKENLQNQQLKSEKNGFESDLECSTSTRAETENLQNRISQLEAEKTSTRAETEYLQNRISQLEAEKTRLQSKWSNGLKYQNEMTDKVKDLTSEILNQRDAIDTYIVVIM